MSAVSDPVGPDLCTRVKALLDSSRSEHLQKKHAAGTQANGVVTSKPNYPKAEAHIATALRFREEAEALDPDHTAPAWAEDLAANKGITSAQLIDWYRRYPEIP